MSRKLSYILGIPLTLTIIVYMSVLTYHNLEKDRVYRECLKDLNYLGKIVEFEGNKVDLYVNDFSGNGMTPRYSPSYKDVPNCLKVLDQ